MNFAYLKRLLEDEKIKEEATSKKLDDDDDDDSNGDDDNNNDDDDDDDDVEGKKKKAKAEKSNNKATDIIRLYNFEKDNSTEQIPVCPVVFSEIDGVPTYNAYIFGSIWDPTEYVKLINILTVAESNVRINIIIDSPGGSIDIGVAIGSAILRSKATVCTVGAGLVASVAMFIFSCGHKQLVTDYATFMFHMSSHGDWGNSQVIKRRAESIIKYVVNQLLHISLEKGHLTEEEYRTIIEKNEDVYISSAVMKSRIVDNTVAPSQEPASAPTTPVVEPVATPAVESLMGILESSTTDEESINFGVEGFINVDQYKEETFINSLTNKKLILEELQKRNNVIKVASSDSENKPSKFEKIYVERFENIYNWYITDYNFFFDKFLSNAYLFLSTKKETDIINIYFNGNDIGAVFFTYISSFVEAVQSCKAQVNLMCYNELSEAASLICLVSNRHIIPTRFGSMTIRWPYTKYHPAAYHETGNLIFQKFVDRGIITTEDFEKLKTDVGYSVYLDGQTLMSKLI